MPLSTLGIGTQVVTRAGPQLAIAKVEKEQHPSGVAVYNLEVAGDHTYFVGDADGGVWVHNACRLPDVRVIGNLDDTARFAHWPYYRVLRVPSGAWTPAINDAWIQEGIQEGASFRLASPITFRALRNPPGSEFRTRIYYRELKQLLAAGYGRAGDFLRPAGNW